MIDAVVFNGATERTKALIVERTTCEIGTGYVVFVVRFRLHDE